MNRTVVIIVNETSALCGLFEARLESGKVLVTASSIPFIASAKVLLAAGYHPDNTLEMRHLGSRTTALTGRLGAVAAVETAKQGSRRRRRGVRSDNSGEGAPEEPPDD